MTKLKNNSVILSLVLVLLCGCGKELKDLQNTSDTSTLSAINVLDPAKGNLRLVATDAPFTYDSVTSAKITVSRIDIKNASSGYITVMSQPATLDLVNLKNGMISVLSDLTIAPGEYDEIRLLISSASVDLKNGSHFNLTVPSGAQSGLKVFISPAISVNSQMSKDVLLDFDLSRSFVALGNSQNVNQILGFNFSPIIRASNLTSAGTIAGKINSDNGTNDLSDDLPLAGAVVGLSQNGNTISTAVTEANGNYKFIGLPAGSYTLTISSAGFSPRDPINLSVTSGNITMTDDVLLNFVIQNPAQ
ncbi:MAG: DUF4382 domain-containing protein [Bacteriovorax sp.]|jgi:hypothetical protein